MRLSPSSQANLMHQCWLTGVRGTHSAPQQTVKEFSRLLMRKFAAHFVKKLVAQSVGKLHYTDMSAIWQRLRIEKQFSSSKLQMAFCKSVQVRTAQCLSLSMRRVTTWLASAAELSFATSVVVIGLATEWSVYCPAIASFGVEKLVYLSSELNVVARYIQYSCTIISSVLKHAFLILRKLITTAIHHC